MNLYNQHYFLPESENEKKTSQISLSLQEKKMNFISCNSFET